MLADLGPMEGVSDAGMGTCRLCRGALAARKLPRYLEPPLGIGGVILEDAVIESYCATCGERAEITIPDLAGLIAAVAVVRCTLPLKLNGEEIRFMRRALGWAAKEMAEKLNVRAETASRWEREEDPIGPGYEKVLRIAVCSKLRKDAPRTRCSVDDILALDLRGVRPPDQELEMVFRLVPDARAKKAQPPAPGKTWEARRAA